MQYRSFMLRGSYALCFSPSSPLVLNEKQECFCTDIESTYIVKLPFCVIILLRRREGLQYRIRFNSHMMRVKFTDADTNFFFFFSMGNFHNKSIFSYYNKYIIICKGNNLFQIWRQYTSALSASK